MKKFLKISYIVFFILALFFSKASAVPTFVDAFSVNGQEGNTHGLTFSSDGTRVYIIGHSSDTVYEYLLDTPWDISSITSGLNGELLIRGAEEGNVGDPRDIKFNTDGFRLFVLDRVISRVYQWELTTAWDITTGSYTTGNFFSVNDQEPASNGLAFSPDGTNMFVVGTNPDTVFQYSLTTGFDITTAAYTGNSFGISSAGSNPEGLEFSRDGTQMFVLGSANDKIFQYTHFYILRNLQDLLLHYFFQAILHFYFFLVVLFQNPLQFLQRIGVDYILGFEPASSGGKDSVLHIAQHGDAVAVGIDADQHPIVTGHEAVDIA